MFTVKKLIGRLALEDNGGEVLEYALILGLIAVATIAAITTIGTKVLARWNSVSGASL
jgi:Flp pilus assembly pilin Flp